MKTSRLDALLAPIKTFFTSTFAPKTITVPTEQIAFVKATVKPISEAPFIVDKLDSPHQIRVGMAVADGSQFAGLCVRMVKQQAQCRYSNLRDLLTALFPDSLALSAEHAGIPTLVEAAVEHASNNIARCTRRGRGNVVIVNPNTQFNLNGLNEAVTIYETIALNPDELLVLYHGNNRTQQTAIMDGPFIAKVQKNGKVAAYVLQNTPEAMGSAMDYGRMIRIA